MPHGTHSFFIDVRPVAVGLALVFGVLPLQKFWPCLFVHIIHLYIIVFSQSSALTSDCEMRMLFLTNLTLTSSKSYDEFCVLILAVWLCGFFDRRFHSWCLPWDLFLRKDHNMNWDWGDRRSVRSTYKVEGQFSPVTLKKISSWTWLAGDYSISPTRSYDNSCRPALSAIKGKRWTSIDTYICIYM